MKSTYKKAHVTVGGYIVTLFSEAFGKYLELFSDFFDSAIVNEGEEPLLKLVENLSSGKGLEDVPNIIYCDNNKIRFNDVAHSVDINTLPAPDLTAFRSIYISAPKRWLPILASRGCYWGKALSVRTTNPTGGAIKRVLPLKLSKHV